jgi:steroid Delta-isomerase
MSDPVRDALTTYAKAWSNDDRESFLSLFADEASIEDPVGSPKVEGKDAIAEFWDNVHSMPMTYETEVVRIVSCGNEGVLVFNVTTRGEGMTMTVKIVDVFAFNDEGKVVSMRAFWDSGCMAMG